MRSSLSAALALLLAGCGQVQSTDQSTVHVTAPAAVAVSIVPSAVSLATAGAQRFGATVTGGNDGAVTWSASCGAITAEGDYTAPSSAGACTVTATSVADPSRQAFATVTVTGSAGGGGGPAVTVSMTRTSAWAGGYNADVTIQNGGAAALTGWTLQFDTADTGVSVWSAVQAARVGTTVSISNESWNGTLAPGGKATFGLGASTSAAAGWAPPTTARLNGASVPVTTAVGGGGGTAATPAIGLAGRDVTGKAALQVTVSQGVTIVPLTLSSGGAGSFSVASNNPRVASVAIVGGALRISSADAAGGRAGLRITEAGGAVRHVGLRVRDSAGALPGFPRYVSVGVVSEDSDADLGMFRGFGAGDLNTYADNRYIYLNGGPAMGWWTWSGTPGDRARRYVRNSLQLGMIPTFVWYNIPDGGESYTTDLSHVQDAAYMQAYFKLLEDTLAIFNEEAPDETIMMVMEPDCIGYMMQLSHQQPGEIQAYASAARTAGAWTASDRTEAGAAAYPDTLPGLVSTINHVIKRDAPQVVFGWQFNVWASLDGSPQAPRAPKDLMKVTDPDQYGWADGRTTIVDNARRIAAYYVAAGILTEGADFVSFDKYGLDAVGYQSTAAADPGGSMWFFNADHWSNYLLFVKTIHETTGKPVALWQLPVGRTNHSTAADPRRAGGAFPDLDQTTNRYEDSTAAWFLGDTFVPGSPTREAYFASDVAADPLVTSTASQVTWGSHMAAARDAGVFNVMFGDGVGISTKARPLTAGAAPPDDWWLMVKLQRYLASPAALP